MNVTELETFIEVVRKGSFTEVARARSVAPSSISRSIASLEEKLGIRLFQRTTRTLKPTKAGLAYFHRVEPVIEELERARQLASCGRDELRGKLRVALPAFLIDEVVLPELNKLLSKYPNVQFEFVASDQLLDMDLQKLDLAIIEHHLRPSMEGVEPLTKLEYIVCTSQKYQKTIGPIQQVKDLDHARLLMHPFTTQWKFSKKTGVKEVYFPKEYITINSELSLKKAVLNSLGVAILPSVMVDGELKRGHLVRVLSAYQVDNEGFQSHLWLIHRARYSKEKIADLFIGFLRHRLSSF